MRPPGRTLARAAHRDLGRGSGRPARLDHGDTFPHALASAANEPPLFVGDDVTQADVTPAPTPQSPPS